MLNPWRLLFLLFLIPVSAYSQKQTNIWYFGENAGLDFNHNPPKVLHDGALRSHEGSSVMSDKDGKLLFYSNGETVWNKNHEIMENGTNIGGHTSSRQSCVIVPKPNDDGLYYVFTTSDFGRAVKYSIVNLNINNGLGKVIEKDIMLHAKGSESLSVIGKCKEGQDEMYWVMAAANEDPGKIFTYKVDRQGIKKEPVISYVPISTWQSYIKISPAGDKVAIIYQYYDNEHSALLIGDFDFSSGSIFNIYSKKVKKHRYFNQVEFSPNGQFLYVSNDSFIDQMDLNVPLYPVISTVKTTMFTIGDFQIAPDGNLYIASYEHALSMIVNPNEKGLEGKYFENILHLQGKESGLGLPNFVRSYLYQNFTTNAGKDTTLCSGQSFALGSQAEEGISYSWYPSLHLSDPTVANPLFSFTNTSEETIEFEYLLTASDNYCSTTDTVKIKVFPAPPAKITGSRSVCPGVMGVEYAVPPKQFYAWRWEVEGGSIMEGQGTSSIKVNWGETNPAAKVRLIATSLTGCTDTILDLPVNINVQLDTETPQGPQEVCYNQRHNIAYTVTNTNGSIYTWSADGGTITSGQGSHRVEVNWHDTGLHRIWVHEKSTTNDTICFGESKRLDVLVYKDSTQIHLNYISTNFNDDKLIIIQANENSLQPINNTYALYRRAWGESNWELVREASKNESMITDDKVTTEATSYEYKVSTLNACQEEIESLPHRSILLKGNTQEKSDMVLLEWNAYEGWFQGVSSYEIWRKVDKEVEYTLIDRTGPNTLQYSAANGADGFVHTYRIKANSYDVNISSLSNEVMLSFPHPLSVPNVFTPNGDGLNETFHISKLELYPDNELAIYNRWGQVVYTQKGYANKWRGENITAGVYYFTLKVDKINAMYKGWVQILK